MTGLVALRFSEKLTRSSRLAFLGALYTSLDLVVIQA